MGVDRSDIFWSMLIRTAVVFLLSLAPPALADDLPTISSLLVLPPQHAPAKRSPVPMDPALTLWAEAKLAAPVEGEGLPEDAARRWKLMKPDEKGVYSGEELVGGWAFANVHVDQPRVLLLNAGGSAQTFVDGQPRVGDVYRAGWVGLPIVLRAGDNPVYFRAARGELAISFAAPPKPLFVVEKDSTLPDVVVGDPEDPSGLWAGLVVTNATTTTISDVYIRAGQEGQTAIRTALPALAPLSIHKAAFRVAVGAASAPGSVAVRVEICRGPDRPGGAPLVVDSLDISIPAKLPKEVCRRTFRSEIDGSVQYYAVNAATPAASGPDAAKPGLILSLHGASVEATNQAKCYSPRDWAHVISPTNRRPYGFDWEDWGRIDADEVLRDAGTRYPHDPRRMYLTGHSMGGHGTWQIGVLWPGRFAAIAPSAGWISFATYAGAVPDPETADAVEKMFVRAAASSRTLAYLDNIKGEGVYVLHGDQDDNVPVEQARTMRTELAKFHPDFAYHEQPGAGHWWGDQCVDWAPLMRFLKDRELPEPAKVDHVRFVTPSPAVVSRVQNVGIQTQLRSNIPSSVDLTIDRKKGVISGTTANVAVLSIDRPEGWDASIAASIEIDGTKLAGLAWNGSQPLMLYRSPDEWGTSAPAALAGICKNPTRAGPFKTAFNHHALLVYATRGTPEMNSWSLAKARYDSETFAYRGNGSFELVADTDLPGKLQQEPDRNVILYGDAVSNAAYAALLPDCPIRVDPGQLKVGDRAYSGEDLAAFFVFPSPTSPTAEIGVIAGTGMPGARAAAFIPIFAAGIAMPDWCVINSAAFTKGPAGAVAAGFFTPDWKYSEGESVFGK